MNKQYQQEAKERWGNTSAYKTSEKRTSQYSKEDWKRIQAEASEIYAQFHALVGKELTRELAEKPVRAWQKHISTHYYECTDQILAGLGQIYIADERFTQSIDKFGEGTAQMMAEAIALVCGE